MASIAHLATIVSARTGRFDRRINKSRSVFARFTKSIAGATGLIGGAGLSFAFLRLGKSVEGFNQAMTSSIAIMGEVSHALREDMEAAAIDAARVTKFSATDAAKSYFFLASAGLDAVQSIKALPRVAKFAQAGMFDMALATDLLTDAQSALGLTVADASKNYENMTRVSDVLVKANTLANASVQQFSEALTNKAGAKLKAFGIDLEEGVAVLAAYADQGIKASEAGTAYAIVLRDLTRAAIENRQAFADASISVFDSSGELRNAADIVGDLEQAMAGLSDEMKIAELIGLGIPTKSVSFTQALLGTSEQIREYEKALRDAAGTTDEVADKQMTTWSKGWNAFTAAVAEFAQRGQPAIDDLGRGLSIVAEKAAELNLAEGPKATGRSEALAAAMEAQEVLEGFAKGGELSAAQFAEFEAHVDRLWKAFDKLTESGDEAQKALEDAATSIENALVGPMPDPADLAAWKKSFATMGRLAEGFYRDTRTEAEAYAETVEQINKAAAAGAFEAFGGKDTVKRALEAATAEFEEAMKPARATQRAERIGFGRELDRSTTSIRGLQLAGKQVQKVEDKGVVNAVGKVEAAVRDLDTTARTS